MHPQQQLALALLAYAAQRGLDVPHLARSAGLNQVALLSAAHGPLSASQWHGLWHNAAELAQDSTFGLHFGEAATAAALGVVGQLVQSSRTVGEALTHAAGLVPMLTEQLWLELVSSPSTVLLRFHRVPTSPAIDATFGQVIDFLLAFVLHEVDGLVLERLRPRAVRFPPGAGYLLEHARVLRVASLQEGQPGQYEIELEGSHWSTPILTANYALQAVLLKQISQWHPPRQARGPWQEKIRRVLLANSYLGMPTLEELAANFHTSARSLQRKLRAEGTSYQEVADMVRKALALHYLQAGAYPLKEVSYLLGYQEFSAFSRAFKRWTGSSPARYATAGVRC